MREGCFTCEYRLILAVLSREERVCTRVMMRYRSNSTVFIGPDPCVYGLPPRVYHGYRGYTVTDV